MTPFPILILGPTAAGKTSLALELAGRLSPGGGECVCCDSMQVYRGLDIGTAKPTAAEQARAPHHLLDIVDPWDDSFSVDRWLELSRQAVSSILARNRWPIIVGGTNLYVQAYLRGLADVPPPDEAQRAALAALDQRDLRARLEAVDPEAAQRIHFNDRRRAIRAIEVFQSTGTPLSRMQTQWVRGGTEESGTADVFIVGLEYSVEAINRRINARVRAMMDAGFLEEVKRLDAGAERLGRNAREALGYKQLLQHLAGECTLEEAIEQIKIRTRRFAKQQRTWLRRFRMYPASAWIDASDDSTQTIAEQALASIVRHTNTCRKIEPGSS